MFDGPRALLGSCPETTFARRRWSRHQDDLAISHSYVADLSGGLRLDINALLDLLVRDSYGCRNGRETQCQKGASAYIAERHGLSYSQVHQAWHGCCISAIRVAVRDYARLCPCVVRSIWN